MVPRNLITPSQFVIKNQKLRHVIQQLSVEIRELREPIRQFSVRIREFG